MRTPAAYLAVLCFLAAAAAAQEPPAIVSETVDVRVVNVEVVVTDRRGERVPDLPAEAFELLVDGQPRAIDFFQEVSGRQVTRAQGGLVQNGARIALRTLLFVDDQHALASDRDRVLGEIERSLEELEPQDEVAVVAFDGRRLTRLTDWTRDLDVVRGALRQARQRPAYGMQRLATLHLADETRRDKDELAQAMDQQIRQEASAVGGDAGELVRSVADDFRSMMDRSAYVDQTEYFDRDTARQIERDTSRVIDAASAALRTFSGGSARKAMILLSGGWPNSALEFVTSDGTKSTARAFSEGLEADRPGTVFAPLFDLANTLDFTLYPVDLAGVERVLGGAEDNPFNSVFGNDVDAGTRTVVQLQQGGVSREEQVHLALELLADRTGGIALLNTSGDHALSEVVDDTRSYYWLGFSFDSERDDDRHRITVRLAPELRSRYRARSRQSFADPSQGTVSTQVVEAGLLFGDTSGAGPLQVRFSAPRRTSRRRLEIDVEVRIPLDRVELVEIGGRFQGRLEVRLAALDDRGRRSETSVEPLLIDGERAPSPGDYYLFGSTLSLGKTSQRVQVAVHDLIGGGVLAASSALSPGDLP